MDVLQSLNVSRETLERLTIYVNLLKLWNPKINLIARSTLPDVWTRHIQDSAQVFDCAPEVNHWVDLGSGGGLPGLVVAILGHDIKTPLQVTLVESDQRKCTFLRTVIRETGVSATVLAKRVEDIPSLDADVLSARALTQLSGLLGYTQHHMRPDGIAIFPKGEKWQKEIEDARDSWRFDVEPVTSKTESAAAILKIRNVSRV